MGNILKINCRELYKSGIYINAQVSVLDKIVEDMKVINSNIKNAWNGNDYDNFCSNFDQYLASIKPLEMSLIDKASLLKSIAVKHGSIDKNLYDNLNRGIKDER